MTWSDWQKNGWLKPRPPDRVEIANKLKGVERDLRVSGDPHVDDDGRFIAAYNAALQCPAAALLAAGFEASTGGGAHHHTIESLRLTIGDDGTLSTPLQAFRAKRAGAVYESVGIASVTEIDELRDLAAELRDRLTAWLRQQHPHVA
jgi:hypothetical protein